MKVNIELEINPATGDVTSVKADTSESSGSAVVAPAITYPYSDPEAQGHTFKTKEEHDDWKRRVSERDANLVEGERERLAKAAVLQPGQSDMTTWSADDLYFYDLFYVELAGYGGPREQEKRFNNGITYGTLNDFNNPNMQAAIDLKHDVMVGKRTWDWSSYTGHVRAELDRRRAGGGRVG